MPTIKETSNQMIQFVFPEHANNFGTLHGGRMMNWIMVLGTITSSRTAKGLTVLGSADSIDFINPVRVGEIVILDSWVEYTGKSSMEIGLRVQSENPYTGEKKLTTSSHLAFIAIDDKGKPKEIQNKIQPEGEEEISLYQSAEKRKQDRLRRMESRKETAEISVENVNLNEWHIETVRVVLPEDAFYGNYLSVGKLMMDIDEAGAILARKFTRGVVVTGSVDDVHFFEPIKVGEVITLHARINYVGRSSMDIEVNVLTENLTSGIVKHACTAYLNFVNIDKSGKPREVAIKLPPSTEYEKQLWQESLERKQRRIDRVRKIKRQ